MEVVAVRESKTQPDPVQPFRKFPQEVPDLQFRDLRAGPSRPARKEFNISWLKPRTVIIGYSSVMGGIVN